MRDAELVHLARQLAHDPVAGGLGVARRGRSRRLEVVARARRLRQQRRIVLRQARTARRTGAAGRRAARAAPLAPPRSRAVSNCERRQIRLGEIPVVVRFFLAAHRERPARRRIPQARFLVDAAAPLEQRDLPVDLVLERALHVTERVEVLDLGLDAEAASPGTAHRDVGVAAEAALFHVAVVDAGRDQDGAQAAEELGRIRRCRTSGSADDLDQRHAAAIEIERRRAIRVGKPLVQRLPGVLFEVHAGDPDTARFAAHLELQGTLGCERPVVLRDLVALGKVRDRSSSCARRSTAREPCSRAREPP